MIKSLVGQEIRKLRTKSGYSQEKFAIVCGLDRTYIASVELGKRNVSIENLNKIAKGLNVTLSELFNFGTPVRKTIILDIKGEKFLLESNQEITRGVKNHIESICQCAFDEDSDFNRILQENGSEDMSTASNFQIAELFEQIVNDETEIEVKFKAIDLEVHIRE